MTTDCLTLLAMSPDDALNQMVQEVLVSGFDVSDLALSGPVAGQGLSTTVNVTVKPETSAQEDWNYYGTIPLTYTRLDLNDTFGSLNLQLKLPLPTTSAIVAQALSTAFGIEFADEDYVQEAVDIPPAGRYVFRAAPTSTRWSGQVVIQIFMLYAS